MIGILKYHECTIDYDDLCTYLKARSYIPDSLIDKIINNINKDETFFGQELSNDHWAFVNIEYKREIKKIFIICWYEHKPS